MPSDKTNVLECLVKAQHFQRITNKCIVKIEFLPNLCDLSVVLILDKYYEYNFNTFCSFQENANELQRLEEKFYQLEEIKQHD